MTGPTWRELYGSDAERRLVIHQHATAVEMWAERLAVANAEEAEAMLPRVVGAFESDAKTLALARAVIDRKRTGAAWSDAVDHLRRRGEKLEQRARRPRSSATCVLVGIWGGRRWRTR
jgi:hypothetical protein